MKDNLLLKLNNFKSIIELVQVFSTEKKCIKALEQVRWGNNVVSPYDENSKVYKCSDGYYKCANTKKEFNVKTGTLFENSKVRLQKWFVAIYLITSHKKRYFIFTISKRYTCYSKDSMVYASKN